MTTRTSDMLDTRLDEAHRRYVDANPTSASWATRAIDVLPAGNTRSVLHFDPFPFRVASAERQFLVDVDGHRYIDLLGNYTAGLLGHSPEPVRAAAHAAIDGGWALGSVHPDEVRLGELIVGRFSSIEQVRFTNSGTEANLMSLAVATNHTGRNKVLVFDGGYHGGVLTFGSARDVNVPHDWIVSTYNDVEAVDAAFVEHPELDRCRTRGTAAGVGRLHPRRTLVPRGAASTLRRDRHPVDLRRGDDVEARTGWCTGAARDHP